MLLNSEQFILRSWCVWYAGCGMLHVYYYVATCNIGVGVMEGARQVECVHVWG